MRLEDEGGRMKELQFEGSERGQVKIRFDCPPKTGEGVVECLKTL